KIDAHQHFWQYDKTAHSWISDEMNILRKDYMPPELKAEMDKSGYDGCVAVQAAQSEEETNFLLQLADEYDYIKGVVGWVDLQDFNVKARLAHFARYPKLCGFRHIVQHEADDFLLNPAFMRGVRLLPEFNLSYDLLIYERQLPVAMQFVSYMPGCRLVVDHIAKPLIAKSEISTWQQNLRSLGQYGHVYCKLSGMVTEADWQQWKPEDIRPYLEVALEAFGPDRLMIGSDWPVCRLAASYQEVMGVVEDFISTLSDNEQAGILGQNAIRFYQLEV
ncbi:MAG: amidohydrolase family protein, partial [Cyclobacteriaceae bacterium]